MTKKVYTMMACIEMTEENMLALQEILLDFEDIHSVTFVDEAANEEDSDGKEN